jgi:hypothetical protein
MTSRALSLSLSEVSAYWPLIRYLMDDSVYKDRYNAYVRAFSRNVFTVANINQLFERNHRLIAPYVVGPEETEQAGYSLLPGTAAFTTGLSMLKQRVVARNQAVQEYLNAL